MPTTPTKSEHHPIRKPHNRWFYYSLTAVLAWLIVIVVEITVLVLGTREFPTLFRIAMIAIVLVPAFALFLVVVMGSRIFPWRYSVFGPYERAPPPKGFQPHIRLDVVPLQTHDIIRYDIGKDGIDLTYQRGTRAFLPACSISSIGPAAWRTYVVEHDSPEIESPLVVSQEVGEAILAGLAGPEKS